MGLYINEDSKKSPVYDTLDLSKYVRRNQDPIIQLKVSIIYCLYDICIYYLLHYFLVKYISEMFKIINF